MLAVSFVALGLHFKPLRLDWRPGLVVAITIPLVLAITFVVMYYAGVGLHKISLGSLIIALGLLVDDAIIAVEMMVQKARRGLRQGAGRDLRLRGDGDADADRHADHRGRLPADRPGAVDRRRVHLRDLRRDRRGAGDLVAGVGVLRALPRHRPARGAAQGRQPRAAARAVRHAVLHALSRRRRLVRAPSLEDDRRDRRLARPRRGRHGRGAAAVLPRLEPARGAGRPLVSGRAPRSPPTRR